jgi:hypothetical protein
MLVMNPTPQKAREFWIDFEISPNSSTHQISDISLIKLGHPYKNVHHLIERAHATRLEEALKVAREALDKEHDHNGTFKECEYGNCRACVALSDIESILGEIK